MKTVLFYVATLGLSASWLGWDSFENRFASRRLINNKASAESQLPSGNRTTLVSMATANATDFFVQGTEPFWSVTISKRGIV